MTKHVLLFLTLIGLIGPVPSVYCMYNPAVHRIDAPAPRPVPQSAAPTKEKPTCLICMEEYDKNKRVCVKLACSVASSPHEMCQTCTLRHIQSTPFSRPTCPFCRRPFKLTNLRLVSGKIKISGYHYDKLHKDTKKQLLEILRALTPPEEFAQNLPAQGVGVQQPIIVPLQPYVPGQGVNAHLPFFRLQPMQPDRQHRRRRAHEERPSVQPRARESVRDILFKKTAAAELFIAGMIGLVLSVELKEKLSAQEKRTRELNRISYAPLILLPNILLSRGNPGRLTDWRTYALWITGLISGIGFGRLAVNPYAAA